MESERIATWRDPLGSKPPRSASSFESLWPLVVTIRLRKSWRSVSECFAGSHRGSELSSVTPIGRKEGHFGTIYQASNWLFLGASHQSYLRVNGAIVHPRSLYERYGPGGQSVAWLKRHVDPHAERVPMPAKLKYVYVFDRALRRQLAAQAQPYLKRVGSSDGAALGDQPREGGSTPTPTLHSSHQESTDGRSQQQVDA